MTSQSPRIYTYKITFEEVPYYYYGVHKEKRYDEEYWGSPMTHKWCWELYTPKKQILEVFEYSDDGYLTALEIEKRIIKPILNEKLCLNENVGGIMSLSCCRKSGENHFKNSTACFSLSKEKRIEVSKKVVQENKKNKVGIFGMSKEEIVNAAKKGGMKSFELKTGVFSVPPERRSEISKKMNLQRWRCLETGYISSPGGLGRYQRARGIDTSNRERVM